MVELCRTWLSSCLSPSTSSSSQLKWPHMTSSSAGNSLASKHLCCVFCQLSLEQLVRWSLLCALLLGLNKKHKRYSRLTTAWILKYWKLRYVRIWQLILLCASPFSLLISFVSPSWRLELAVILHVDNFLDFVDYASFSFTAKSKQSIFRLNLFFNGWKSIFETFSLNTLSLL